MAQLTFRKQCAAFSQRCEATNPSRLLTCFTTEAYASKRMYFVLYEHIKVQARVVYLDKDRGSLQ